MITLDVNKVIAAPTNVQNCDESITKNLTAITTADLVPCIKTRENSNSKQYTLYVHVDS